MATTIYGKYSHEQDKKILRLVTYKEPLFKTKRTAIIISQKVFDLNVLARTYFYFYEREKDYEYLSDVYAPTDMISLIRNWQESRRIIENIFKFALDNLNEAEKLRGPENERVVFDLSEITIAPPLRPGKFIHTAGNFREHAEEAEKAGWPFPIPQWISFLKNPDAIIGHDDQIIKPRFTNQLDHELEMAIIIGRKCKNVSPAAAEECIFGFTVFNDITARDIQRQEMKSGLLNFGKNLDTFAPLGPAIVPKEYIGDVHSLTMELRVNGDVRQFGSTSKLSVKIQEIVSKYSWVTLYPGDIISTGTISGVAAFRKPDPTPFFLKNGDIVESEIEKIGVLRNQVVEK